MSELYFTVFILCLFFTSIICLKKNKTAKDILLMWFILLFGLESLTIFSIYKGWIFKIPEIFYGDYFFWTLLGPLLVLYIDFSIRDNFKLKPIHILHLLPLIIVFTTITDYIYYFVNRIDEITYLNEKKSFLSFLGVCVYGFNSALYYFLAILKLYRYRKTVPHYYSYTKNVNLNWLYYFTNGFALYLSIGALSFLLKLCFDYHFPANVYEYIGISSLFYVLGIGFYGYKQKQIHFELEQNLKPAYSLPFKESQIEIKLSVPVENQQNNNDEPEKTKYLKSGLKDDELNILIEKLNREMEIQKPYLDCEFNLKNLAEKLETSQHKLSQLLNEHLHTNFFDFVNKYRIEEVKKLLTKPDSKNYTLLAIAFDAGFNSKSTFYNVFKKYTGQTPTEYRKKLQTI